MCELIRLWNDPAPYSEFSPEQAQPTLKPYPVPGSSGAVIVLAGGAYKFKSGYEMYPVAERLQSYGVTAFALDYRVNPCHKLAPLSDCSRAIRLVRSLGYQKVAVLGFSAGGHLCCSAATHYDAGDPNSPDPIERYSSRPDAFIPCYAVSSMISYSSPWTVQNLLGNDYCNLDDLRFFSAELNITRDTPPAFIWHTVTDAAVPVESSLRLALALSAAQVPYELHVFPEGGHGLGLAEGNPVVIKWSEYLKAWLERNGYNEEKKSEE